MPTRIVIDEYERKQLIKLIQGQKLPFSASVTKGKNRTWLQNRLQRQWCNEIAEQLDDRSAEQVRGECKLTIGVPILRSEDDEFCEVYDRVIRPLSHEQKLECMMVPIDMPITRRMNTDQKTRYLDSIYQQYTEQGVVLTIPPDKRFGPPIGEKVA